MRTAYGLKRGRSGRAWIPLFADEGDSLDIEATFFVCDDWPNGVNLLGHEGFLARVRLGLDLQHNHIYFGPLPPG